VGIVVSLILIAVGAILTWGVEDRAEGVNLDAVGVILMIVGLVGILLTMLFWSTWWGPGYWRRGAYVEGAPPARRWGWGGRRYVVEEEEGAPPAGPPGGPPPP
jgi:hypothetical protein